MGLPMTLYGHDPPSTLEARKEGGTWRVMIPRDTGQDADRIPTGHDTTPDPPPAGLISQLQSEVDYLRSELTAALRTAERERERADVLQREALQRLEALTTGDRAQHDATGSPESRPADRSGPDPAGHEKAPQGGVWAVCGASSGADDPRSLVQDRIVLVGIRHHPRHRGQKRQLFLFLQAPTAPRPR